MGSRDRGIDRRQFAVLSFHACLCMFQELKCSIEERDLRVKVDADVNLSLLFFIKINRRPLFLHQ